MSEEEKMKGSPLNRRKKSRIVLPLFFSLVLLLPSCTSVSKPPALTKCTFPPPSTFIPEFEGVPYCGVNYDLPLSAVSKPEIYVLKKDRRLLLINEGILVRDYKVGLGPNPTGDKSYRGDGRTPEGEFIICKKNGSSKFYKSLGLNYPNFRHAEEALQEGRISPEQYKEIVRANQCMTLPPFNTTLGGAIFIHGGGGRLDWTEGCIAVSNSIMDELFQVIDVGTPVKVLP